jgi:hypothetical protein
MMDGWLIVVFLLLAFFAIEPEHDDLCRCKKCLKRRIYL